MEIYSANSLVWAIVIAIVLIIIFGSFGVKATVALDIINVKLRLQISLFGLTLINLLIYYQDCAIFIQKPSGKTNALSLKPVTKFETKFGFNVAKIIKDKNVYLNLLVGLDCNAYITSLIAGTLLLFGSNAAAKLNVNNKSKLNLNINATGAENKGKIFLRFNFRTSIAKIFIALLESI